MGRSLQEIVRKSARLCVGDSVMRTHGPPLSFIITRSELTGGIDGRVDIRGAFKGRQRSLPVAPKLPGAVPPKPTVRTSVSAAIPSTFKQDWRVIISAETDRPERLQFLERTGKGGLALSAAGLQLIREGKFPFVGEQTERRKLGFELMQQRKAHAASVIAAAAAKAAAASEASAKKATA
jgi:hypothetical protein